MHGTRLTTSQLKEVRTQLLAAQGGKCALCRTTIKASQIAVLDHDHNTGAIRATLHHSCNAVLGRVENSVARFGLSSHFYEWCAGLGQYMQRHKTNVTGMIHSTHFTEEEKRIKRNTKARKARVKARSAK